MKLSELIIKITEATEKGKIEWTERAPNDYACRISNVVAIVNQYVDEDTGELGYTFAIHRDDRPAPSGYLDSEYGDKYSGRFTDLERVFKAARRSALKLDQTYDMLANYLDKKMSL